MLKLVISLYSFANINGALPSYSEQYDVILLELLFKVTSNHMLTNALYPKHNDVILVTNDATLVTNDGILVTNDNTLANNKSYSEALYRTNVGLP